MRTYTLAVRNGGDGGAIAWSLDTSKLPAWLKANKSSGQTPDEIIFTIDAKSLAEGNYEGTLTFSSSNAVKNKQLTVPYAVQVTAATEHKIYLPFANK